jgi:pimeloyl-ACP methyl ester carboxylesterase
VLVGLQRRLIYFPFPAQVPPAEAVVAGAREVRLRTVDGLALRAWLVEAGEPDRGVAVLVANGNPGNRSLRAPLARVLASAGLAVLLFDYRGYGGNPGRPSEQGLARDVRAARRFLIEGAEISPARVLYYGESLGSAVVTELATEHPPAGLVLRSPFVDLASVGRVHYPFLPVRTLLRDRYPLARPARERAGADNGRVRLPRLDRPARAKPRGRGCGRRADASRGDRGRRPQRPRPARGGEADRSGRRALRAGLQSSPNQACSRRTSAITAAGVTVE